MHMSPKVVSLQSARESAAMSLENESENVESFPNNQRSEKRVTRSDRLFVQVTQAEDQNLVGKTTACKILDSSANGIRFLTSEPIPAGCLMDLWVDDSSRPGKFFLSGDVRWSEPVGSVSTMVGIRLQEGLTTDIDQWQKIHA